MSMKYVLPENEPLVFPQASNHGPGVSGSEPMPDNFWNANNSNLNRYSSRLFGRANTEALSGFLIQRIGKEKTNVGLDIAGGSNGVAMRALLRKGVLGEAAVTNLEDRRGFLARHNRHLHHIGGNLLLRSTWDTMSEWREEHAPDGLALVTHLPDGGLQELDPNWYGQALDTVIEWVRPGGLIITQVPSVLAPEHAPTAPQLQEIGEQLNARDNIASITVLPRAVEHYHAIIAIR